MSCVNFDPNANKVTNAYGGYDPNEKGITQYPKYVEANPTDCSFQHPFPPRKEHTSRRKVFSNPILDPVITHYRRFVQDPNILQPLRSDDYDDEVKSSSEGEVDFQKAPCCSRKSKSVQGVGSTSGEHNSRLAKKPIDPIHWKPDLFDTRLEKYYLRNLLNENPYRDFLTSYSEATTKPTYLTEYKEEFSGNPTLMTSSLGTVPGISRPTDIPETCDWKRNRTSKLRDVIFTHEKEPINWNLDYNDPKRYNPWGRHLAGHNLLIERNHRPRPESGVEFNVVTVLPAVERGARGWFV